MVSAVLLVLMITGIMFGYVSPALALLAGMMIGLSGWFKWLTDGVPRFQKPLLQASVIGLGFGMSYEQAFVVGSSSFLISLITILGTFLIAFTVRAFLGSEKKLTMLIASGTAICGGSAIAAVSPSIKANAAQTSMALVVVFVLNAVALFIFPFIGHQLGLSQSQFGLWCALAIHDTSSVVGASEVYGAEALMVATTTKLVRTLWIIPLLLVMASLFKSKEKLSFPWFILGFIGAIFISSHFAWVNTYSPDIVWLARKVLIFTLFLVGLQISIKNVQELGFKSLTVGVLAWFSLAVMSLVYVIYFQ